EAADGEGDQDRLARPPDELGEDILAVRGRPEQVVGRRPQSAWIDLRPRIVGRDLAREDREYEEEKEQPEPDERFAVVGDGAEEVGAGTPLRRLLGRARADGRAGRLDRVRDGWQRHPRSRVRGSR